MALNNLEDRLECAIAHINTSVDIDPWAQNLAVESMRMRIALMKDAQPEIIRCRDCKHRLSSLYCEAWNNSPGFPCVPDDGYCWMHDERRTDEQIDKS